ncbi:3-ketoacyl-CoA thiolase, mitochondrial-like [Pectinophora gossypiella]|uniref:3-ketoacyl-CoA thiolase, mitochondrial-like n=1 Tax=Pectinophora gossypiella TaxID=13191 RepID=UPI00214E314B|nr:3-ketoacyl-CoA thiolase, mitochondrial-like [Pectinophora gossypiella]
MSLKCKGLFVIGAKRTPFCKYGGPLREMPAAHAFAAAAKDVIYTANVDQNTIDNTVVGNVHFLSQCDGGKTPRYCGIYSGVPLDRPALGVNNACASGLRAFIASGVDILTGVANISLTGGTEIMSALPHLVRNVRFGSTLGGNYQFEDYIKTELVDSFCGKSFHKMAEDLARKHGVTREEADEFTSKSYSKWKAAQEANAFADELTNLTVTLKKKEYLVEKDDIVNISAYELQQLPALVRDGTVITGGNSSAAADGASALILANEESIKQQKLTPLARVVGWACVGVDPQHGLGAVVAVERLLTDQGLSVDDVDLFEINETFAAMAVLTLRHLHIDPAKVNVSGGAIALGHPAAATGARMVTHLVHQLRRRNVKRAIATSAAGGGQGVAVLLENV